jgi:hypothetical protein
MKKSATERCTFILNMVIVLLITSCTWLKLKVAMKELQETKGSTMTFEENMLIADAEDQLVIDILSIGSTSRPELHAMQQRTFGSHATVRHFFTVTEGNDTDTKCAEQLTNEQVIEIAAFCRSSKNVPGIKFRLLKELFFEKRSPGWACAQKRPLDGLYSVLMKYKHGEILPPHYLFIIDDDTYINMAAINHILYHDFPYDTPQLAAGCTYFGATRYRMHFLYGGFGSFLSRAAIQNLLRPIDCTVKNVLEDSFSRFSCWRLQENIMGERSFFTDGMSVTDLMYRYATDQPFTEVRNWNVGYCFHSDHALTYFFNMYHIAVPNHELDTRFRVTDALRKVYQYTALSNTTQDMFWCQGECVYEKEKCESSSVLCHYVTPDQMSALFHAKSTFLQ